ncbi:MAG: hypothetical protein IIA60_13375 [Candidatus Marinimicrobia bacterium]|nr:hypothetical protein [Candidatus Neomarinimicrobiota bacterium]
MNGRRQLIPLPALVLLLATGCLVPAANRGTQNHGLRELVRRSDLIVMGRLSQVSLDSTSTPPMALLTVEADEVLWGDMVGFLFGAGAGEQILTVTWIEPQVPGLVNPLQLGDRTGIWLLVRTEGDVYLADGYSFVDPKKRRAVRRYLRKDLLFIRLNATAPAEALTVDLVVRNAHEKDAILPEFRFEGGRLFLHPQVELSLIVLPSGKKGQPLPVSPRENSIVLLDEQDWLTAQSGEEVLVSVPLAALYPLEPGRDYEVRFEIKDFGKDRLLLVGP